MTDKSTDDTQTRRAQLVRYGIPTVAAVVVVLLAIQFAQNGAIGRGALFFLIGAGVILVGSIVLSVRDARAAKALAAADDDDESDDEEPDDEEPDERPHDRSDD